MKIVLPIVVVMLVIVSGVVLVAGFLTREAPAPAAAVATSTRSVPVSGDAAAAFDRKLDAFEQNRGSLRLTEAEVTSKMAQVLSSSTAGSMPVRNLEVRLDPGVIVAKGQVDLGFGQPDMTVRTSVAVNDGRMVGQIDQVSVSGLTLPRAVQNQLIETVLTNLGVTVPANGDVSDLSQLKAPQQLKTFSVGQGELLIEMTR